MFSLLDLSDIAARLESHASVAPDNDSVSAYRRAVAPYFERSIEDRKERRKKMLEGLVSEGPLAFDTGQDRKSDVRRYKKRKR